MTVPGMKHLDDDKAIEMIEAILNSDVADCYKYAVSVFACSDGGYCADDAYEIAANIAFCNTSEPIPEIAREFILLAFLDEIENDNDDAMLDLGSLYYTGRIGEQSYAKAVEYYKMAEAYGNLIASENLGYCYYYGRDVEIDYKKAYHCFIKPALAGRLESLYKIGDMYSKGLYVNQDEDMAFMLYKKAYESIDEDCDVTGDICLRMGNCFYFGNGCDRDIQAALFFYQRSELNYYIQLQNGDFFKKKMLASVIEKINKIREELKFDLETAEFAND